MKLIAILLLSLPLFAFAAEHGGTAAKEHGGSAAPTKEHGGKRPSRKSMAARQPNRRMAQSEPGYRGKGPGRRIHHKRRIPVRTGRQEILSDARPANEAA